MSFGKEVVYGECSILKALGPSTPEDRSRQTALPALQ